MIVTIHLETQIQILGIVWPIRCVAHVHELGTAVDVENRCGKPLGPNLSLGVRLKRPVVIASSNYSEPLGFC